MWEWGESVASTAGVQVGATVPVPYRLSFVVGGLLSAEDFERFWDAKALWHSEPEETKPSTRAKIPINLFLYLRFGPALQKVASIERKRTDATAWTWPTHPLTPQDGA